jgi:hypothetical protein
MKNIPSNTNDSIRPDISSTGPFFPICSALLMTKGSVNITHGDITVSKPATNADTSVTNTKLIKYFYRENF